MITLVSSDNKSFTIDKEVVLPSVFLAAFPESDQPILLPNVKSDVLQKVLEYCEHHRGDPVPEQSQDGDGQLRNTHISKWDREFITVDQEMLFELILAANYLEIKSLLDIGTRTVADLIKGKSPEEIRMFFNVQNDFTPEEEAQIKQEEA
ncbi:hypothetical protein GYMLUDRAFT_49239 [Collybiopsis luxurians FD-317 M1]|uniref:E3 ubiquitin ligase complex SCF subunit n=1 Tax=Collybiopsis luxurians FD-317 M1 TaxID=944289 RepID=A0A0D0C722_9AGAR|nr:hypothetical protein GYMLUDRAFT_49239 [Collybiopsis luxurians FD-317 M1]